MPLLLTLVVFGIFHTCYHWWAYSMSFYLSLVC